VLGVVWAHDLKSTLAGHSLLPYQNQGGAGVDLFFAISGILITTRILEEESLCGFFDIRKFYIRRLFRIQPAAWLYLAVIGCLLVSGSITMLWRHWFGALGMYENFLYRGQAFDFQGFFVGHFWSLAVEEHFYILLSLFLLLVKRRRASILLFAFLGLMVLRSHAVITGHLTEATWRRTYYQLPILVYAASVAIALQRENWRRFAVRYLRPWVVFSATVAFVLLRELRRHLDAPAPADFHPTSLLTAAGYLRTFFFVLWIASTITHGSALSTRFLEWAPLRWLGRLSYSLYLWHVLFFSAHDPQVHVSLAPLLALSRRPVKYFAALAAASLSYYLVERPLMRLGHRLAPPATPGHPDLAPEAVNPNPQAATT